MADNTKAGVPEDVRRLAASCASDLLHPDLPSAEDVQRVAEAILADRATRPAEPAPDVARLVQRLRTTPLYHGHGEESDLPEEAAAALATISAEKAALRAEVVEECAKVAEARLADHSERQKNAYAAAADRQGELWHARHVEAWSIAAAIRALADPGKPGEA